MTAPTEVAGYNADALDVAHAIRADWAARGLHGAFWARNIDTGEELGFDPDDAYPLTSVVKLPLALVALDRIAAGQLAADQPVQLSPTTATPGPTGLSGFRHPCTVAVEDLVQLMLSVSDNAAADALFALVPPSDVAHTLRGWSCDGIVVRHPVRRLYDTIALVAPGDPALALELAICATTDGGGHAFHALDVASANTGTARALVRLVERIWTDQISVPGATARLRDLLGGQVARHRMASEVASDSTRISSKTGTFLNQRHEVGMIENTSGDRVAVAALTASTVNAHLQPEADFAIGYAARRAYDVLRW